RGLHDHLRRLWPRQRISRRAQMEGGAAVPHRPPVQQPHPCPGCPAGARHAAIVLMGQANMTALLKQKTQQDRQRAPATRMLATFARTAVIDERTRAYAVRALIDTLGVTIAGGGEPAVKALRKAL